MPDFNHVRDYLLNNLNWILPVAAVVIFILLVFWVVMMWLSSRGIFMLLHCVVLDRAEVSIPWRKYRREAHSLWLFRLVLGAIGLLFALPIIAWAIWTFFSLFRQGAHFNAGMLLTILGMGIIWICIMIPFGVIRCLTRHFVVPIMYMRGVTCMEGWRILLPLLEANAGRFILYLLFQIVIGIGIGLIVMAFVVCTCFLGALVLLIPVIGAVIRLPVTVFQRSYPLFYLAQYGPEFTVFTPPPLPTQNIG